MVEQIQINKVTPRSGASWYIKWLASITLLVGMSFTSIELIPYNLYLHLLGITGWLVVGILWHDRALIIVNTTGIFINMSGIMKRYLT